MSATSVRKRYPGPVRAVIFDWAGTTVDYGSLAPVNAFIELFQRHGVTVSAEQARRPMGSHKKEHARLILAMQPVVQQWLQVHGREPSVEDLEALYLEFIPLQTGVIGHHAELIPGVVEAVESLRKQGIGVGSTTGYTREMMASLVGRAESAGFSPESIVCADEVPAGRPAPWMAITSAMQLGIYPMEACVKVGDTLADVAEGLNAGMWTIGVIEGGNLIGLSEEEWYSLDPAEQQARRARGRQELLRSGAHYAIDTIADLDRAVRMIGERLREGERP